MQSLSLSEPDQITIQAQIPENDTLLVRLADNISETEMAAGDGAGDIVMGYAYDETVLQISTDELNYVTGNFDTFFQLGLALEDAFDPATLLWYLSHTNFLLDGRALVNIDVGDGGTVDIPVPTEDVYAADTDVTTETVDVSTILPDAGGWSRKRHIIVIDGPVVVFESSRRVNELTE